MGRVCVLVVGSKCCRNPGNTTMKLHRALSTGLLGLLITGLAAAYLSAAVGLTGYLNARAVSLIAISGAAVAFVAAVIYFAFCELRLRRERHQLTIRN